ncbi:MAG: DNA gyrase/topoisomerase IV subunit A [Bacteroidales bacterium]|nr:DNA gyrase/topoisomerase IV subunit A [Bacteroidales bacterium]
MKDEFFDNLYEENNIENKESENDNISDALSNDKLDTQQENQKKYSQIAETKLSGFYKDWWLTYASYVILERAVPHIDDGLKPVQRRILYAMKKLDDGRYNKVANIIGYTMQFHPHGDASINEALIQLGQKDLLIDTQGNWGNILTGDSAAAPRYIEARLSKFSKEVLFNDKITEWKPSYDGRSLEPVTLPVRFPLLLVLGAEGIAVGLASKILPHNFVEVIDASIKYLKNEDFELFPDFPTGGMIDVSKYNDGLRGGSVKIRAKIKKLDNKTLVITELPFGVTTERLIESIIKVNEQGKIKIKKIDDNTSDKVEIILHLAPGTSTDKTIDALYAFTDCQISVSVNSCVIKDNKPLFIGVKDILKYSVDRTLNLLKKELEIQLNDLYEQWHSATLEKIFIENKIYRKIENAETWDEVISVTYNSLLEYEKLLKRKITEEDILKLLELHIKRISKYNVNEADKKLKEIEITIEEVQNHLNNIVEYTINYFNYLKKTYGADKQRKTELKYFDVIEAQRVVVANKKLYVNREDGFIGTSLKKDEYVCDCSELDDILVVLSDGTYFITKVSDKQFVGKNIVHVSVYNKDDKRTVYNLIYLDGQTKYTYIKRCKINSLLREKKYNLTQGSNNSKILWISSSKSNEADIVQVFLKPKPHLKKLVFNVNFADFLVKGKNAIGNILTKNEVYKVKLVEKTQTIDEGIDFYYDGTINRLSHNNGKYLGKFTENDWIIAITKSGFYRTYRADLNVHFEDNLIFIDKYKNIPLTIVYYSNKRKSYFIKRFIPRTVEKLINLTDGDENSFIQEVTYIQQPLLEIITSKNKCKVINISEFTPVKKENVKGKKLNLSINKIHSFKWIEEQNNKEADEKNPEISMS